MKHCEAMIKVGRVWTRCGRRPTEDHHRLTRARGGLILDDYGERYHHIQLCHIHHKTAHSPGGRESGLLLDGYVTTGPDERPLYLGPDEYLTREYGPVPVRDLRYTEGDHATREGLREQTRGGSK